MQPDNSARPGAVAGLNDPMIGRLLDGRYRILGRVARGGMASVYEATDLRLDRTVAVKVMHPGLGDDDDFAARFVREARSAARLSHPNVVAVFDQGDEDGTVFLAMELVSGHTLRDVIRKESPMPPSRALALIEPVLSALATAHRAGLIHRDIKPENVLIADDGRVKVADFGLAKAVSTDTQHTATGGVLIGTVSYLAPELVVDGRADARADVYAAGVVLYELLTGAKPHEGETPIQVAYKHVHEDVPAPSALADGIPGYLDALVARATARDRAQRPADAAVLLHQVHRVSTALAQGVREDAELEADLRPRVLPLPDVEEPEAVDDREHTDELATVLAPAQAPHHDEHTQALGSRVMADERTQQVRTVAAAHSAPRPGAAGSPGSPEIATGRPRRSRRGPLLLVIALLLAAAAGGGAYWFGWARYTSTPGVLGLGERAAIAKLEDAGLVAATGDPAYSETVAAGKVLASDPSPGAQILDGGTVTIVISLGKERYDVPKLRGMPEGKAEAALEEVSLDVGSTDERYSETVPQGQVIASDPPAGTTLRPGALVDLVVSKGRRPIEVRDWTGKDADRAERVMERKGLVVERSQTEYSDTVAEGDVIAQTPADGTLYRGETVTLVVSDGPELVEVPSGLRASGVEAARQRLLDLGFEVRTENSGSYLGLGYVFSTDPEAGTMVPKGSTITLYLI